MKTLYRIFMDPATAPTASGGAAVATPSPTPSPATGWMQDGGASLEAAADQWVVNQDPTTTNPTTPAQTGVTPDPAASAADPSPTPGSPGTGDGAATPKADGQEDVRQSQAYKDAVAVLQRANLPPEALETLDPAAVIAAGQKRKTAADKTAAAVSRDKQQIARYEALLKQHGITPPENPEVTEATQTPEANADGTTPPTPAPPESPESPEAPKDTEVPATPATPAAQNAQKWLESTRKTLHDKIAELYPAPEAAADSDDPYVDEFTEELHQRNRVALTEVAETLMAPMAAQVGEFQRVIAGLSAHQDRQGLSLALGDPALTRAFPQMSQDGQYQAVQTKAHELLSTAGSMGIFDGPDGGTDYAAVARAAAASVLGAAVHPTKQMQAQMATRQHRRLAEQPTAGAPATPHRQAPGSTGGLEAALEAAAAVLADGGSVRDASAAVAAL